MEISARRSVPTKTVHTKRVPTKRKVEKTREPGGKNCWRWHVARRLGVAAVVSLLHLVTGASVGRAIEITPDVHLNAYLTQAYGVTDGTPLFGLDEDGTFQYRNAALLFRFEMSRNSRFVVQLSHEALGDSPLDGLRDEIELDWAFFQHQFESGTLVRVGRLPIPFGIYNQLRDVGTVLEFYRPPIGIYFEGAFASETVDGAEISHGFDLGGSWGLDVDAYFGSWDRAEFIAPDVFEGKAEDAFGTQLWLTTPVSGLRFGFAAQRFDQVGGIPFLRSGESDRFETFLFSVDADFARFVFRGEVQRIETSFSVAPVVEIPAYYLMAGYRFTDRVALYVLYEDSWTDLSGGPFPPSSIDPFYEDLSAALVYRLSLHALLRLEWHHAETTQADVPLPITGEPYDVDYGILSFSASF